MLRNQPVPDLGIVLLDRGYVLVSERGDYRDQLAFETVPALLSYLRDYLTARERALESETTEDKVLLLPR